MTAIWQKSDVGWQIVQPAGFVDEAALHSLVEAAPHVLPLAGSPRIVVAGREVRLGSGLADLIAVESNGRVAVIEVKLAKNDEARRAVVAQILAYCAVLRGVSRDVFEHEILGQHLAKRQFASLIDALEKTVQDGSFEAESFLQGLDASLSQGAFRLVLVLDDAPPELVRLVGYLESIAEQLTIDLITVSRYEMGGAEAIVPQRVDPERDAVQLTQSSAGSAASKAYYARDGGADFKKAIESLPEDEQPRANRVYEFAKSLEANGLATLWGYHGPRYVTLLPHPANHDAGLVTLVLDGSLWTWRSVFEKRAPATIAAMEVMLGRPLVQGGTVQEPTHELLDVVRRAYAEAAGEQSSPAA